MGRRACVDDYNKTTYCLILSRFLFVYNDSVGYTISYGRTEGNDYFILFFSISNCSSVKLVGCVTATLIEIDVL